MTKKSGWLVAVAAMMLISGSIVHAGELFDGMFDGGRTIRGSGEMATETRDVASFTRVEVSMGVDVVITVGSPQQVKLTFDDNIISKIRTRVRGNTLEIDSRRSISTDGDCRIEITVPSIEAFSLAGSGNIEIHGIADDEFQIEIAGSGDIKVDGHTKMFSIEVAGSGDIDARELVAEEADVEVSGSGSVKVHATKSLNAEISGSGDVRYYGDPENVDSEVSGSGSIRRGRG